MKIPTNLRTDTSVENLIHMMGPILEELELIGRTIPMSEFAKLCRNRKSRLPMRGFNGRQIASQIDFLAHGGSVVIGNLSVLLSLEFDCSSRRSRFFITCSRIIDPESIGPEAAAAAMKAMEKGVVTNV
jgi:hypothetical protein